MPIATALSADQIGDIVTTTLETPMRRKWVDISLPYQEFFFPRYFMPNNIPYGGGRLLTWEVQVRNLESTRYTGAFDQDAVDVTDIFVKAQTNWSVITSNFIYDILEPEWNGTNAQIIDHIAGRQHAMMNSHFLFMEHAMWNNPSSEANRPYEMLGIPHWIVKTSGTDNFAFNGLDPTGHASGAGNIASATHANWSNGTFRFGAISETDFFRKLAEATVKCNFRAPDNFPEAGASPPRYIFCTTYQNMSEYQEHAKGNNDNVGRDPGKYRTPVQIFRDVPVYYVPVLDNAESPVADADHPFYGIDMNNFKFIFVRGWDKKIQKPIRLDGTSTSYKVVLHTMGQFKCMNRRTNFVGHRTS